MKTTTILTRIIPTLSGVKESKTFNAVIAGRAAPLAEELRQAANDDLIDAETLIGALQRLASAAETASQQTAMAEAYLLADMLLGAISEGRAVRIDRVRNTSGDLVRRITRDVASIVDVYQPSRQVLARIRQDAAELTTLVDADIREGVRPAEHAIVAEKIFDAADRLAGASYGDRDAATRSIADDIMSLAA